MRGRNPLIVILPAVPTAIGEIEGGRARDRFRWRRIGIALLLLALVVTLMLGFDWPPR